MLSKLYHGQGKHCLLQHFPPIGLLAHHTDVSFSISAGFTRTHAAVFWSSVAHSLIFTFRVAEKTVLDLVVVSKFNDFVAPLRLPVSSSHTFCTLHILFSYFLYVGSMADIPLAHSFVDNPTVY